MRRRPLQPPEEGGLSVLLFLLLLVLLLLLPPAAGDDRAALLSFKSSVSGDPRGLLRRWSSYAGGAREHCSWPGVECDAAARVVAINFTFRNPIPTPRRNAPLDPGYRLAGVLTPAIAELTHLRVLALPFHAFTGVLPLRLPPQLRVLNLAYNQIEGPLLPSIAMLKSLEMVNLAGNKLNGTIPPELFQLPELKFVSLGFNMFSGAIPIEIGVSCRALQVLELSNNLLIGGIPRGLGNCSELEALILSSNLLDDTIPVELGGLKNLKVLDVSRNSLSGSVPMELGGCTELSVLVLSNPYMIVTVDNATEYNDDIDDFNYFQGGLPESIVMLPKLRVLWVPRATLEGELPGNWGACRSLEMVYLGENLFSGGIPKGLMKCVNLKFLNVSSNKLIGKVDNELPVPCMHVLDVGGNQLSDSIPEFSVKGCPSSQLPLDDLTRSYMSFLMSDALVMVSSLSLYNLGLTRYHNFGSNNFTGKVPPLLLAADNVPPHGIYALLADGNNLSGQLDLGLLSKCRPLDGLIINLGNNLIYGEIPADIGAACPSIVVLDVSDNRISGTIPVSIGDLTGLVGLNLSDNELQGGIPASVQNLLHLKSLSLGHNFLNGSIPPGIGQLLSLEFLDLSTNFLSGEIPSSFTELTNLTTLLLNNNNLTGKIPTSFAYAPSLTMFNVSFNDLSGPAPPIVNAVKCESIIYNPLLQPCHGSIAVPPSEQPGRAVKSKGNNTAADNSSQGNSGGFSSIEIASITSATAIFSVLLVLIILFIYTRMCPPKFSTQSTGKKEVQMFTDIGVPITYDSVVRATGCFNASNCIGSGGFGATYKAEISPGVLVAIKRLSVGRLQGVQQFHAEIKTLGRLRHPNLVTLIGYHLSESEMFLIYNYLPGGNLERFIQERSKRPIDWRMLHKIALDIAKALAYLHDSCVPRILHRDVKPSNILLDNEYNAYLSDFGLARLLGNSETHATTGVAGTFGYVAPEYAMTCRVSDKADVYSYGVVLMELISSKKALDPSFSPYGNGFNIVAWACMLLRQGRARAREFFVDGLWDVAPHDDLVETLHLAVMCTVDSLAIRPTMKQVVQKLKQLQPQIREHR